MLFAGVAMLVSANTQIPVVAGSQRLLTLSGSAVDYSAYDRHAPALSNLQAPNTEAFHSSLIPSAQLKISELQYQPESNLSPERLKLNALSVLRSLPDHYSAEIKAVFKENVQVESQAINAGNEPGQSKRMVNVNLFLLSGRINNDSVLAELQMHPTFEEFDNQLFSPRFLYQNVKPSLDSRYAAETVAANNTSSSHRLFAGVGFPHIETNQRPDSQQYKPYKQLVSFSSDAQGEIVPHVKCMGLSPASVANRAKSYDAKIFQLAVKHNVSASLVKAVVAKESCFNPKARSHVGAIGLMQLMPETAKWLKVKNPANSDQNLAAGIRYLAQLRKRFGSNELALAAYNAGPGNVERYNGIPPFAETENYVKDVMHFYRGYVATTRFVNALNDFE